MDEKPDPPATIRRYRQLAGRIIQNHFGKPPSRIIYKPSGRTNYVFAVNHVEGQFVVRISPDPEKLAAFKKELWATQKVREAGVPSPEVLAVGNDIGAGPYMITRRVTGTEATHYPKRSRIVHEIGRYARIINSIRTKDFGANFDLTTAGTKQHTWSEYLDRKFELEKRLGVFSKYKILPARTLKQLRTVIDATKNLRITPSLNHSDLRLKNVIVDQDGEIAAIVDWEDCLSTIAPQWELSIALHDLSIDEKHIFIEGYGLGVDEIEEMSPLIKAFNMINYSTAIEQAVESQDHKSLDEFRLRLSGALDLYSLPH